MPRRGDVVWVDLEPVRGSEANKRRPAVVVSNDGANASAVKVGRGVITVVPLTTNGSTIRPFQVFLPAGTGSLRDESKAQAEQVRSVDVARIGSSIGRVAWPLMVEIDEALRVHLAL